MSITHNLDYCISSVDQKKIETFSRPRETLTNNNNNMDYRKVNTDTRDTPRVRKTIETLRKLTGSIEDEYIPYVLKFNKALETSTYKAYAITICDEERNNVFKNYRAIEKMCEIDGNKNPLSFIIHMVNMLIAIFKDANPTIKVFSYSVSYKILYELSEATVKLVEKQLLEDSAPLSETSEPKNNKKETQAELTRSANKKQSQKQKERAEYERQVAEANRILAEQERQKKINKAKKACKKL
jgi:uncharacterized protein YlxW (UPF0749 family)